jgi:hypothetical protein
VATTFALSSVQVATFISLLDGSLNDTFGTDFHAFPFAALLGVLFLLRWNDLHSLLNNEERLATRFPTRMLGLGLALSPLLFGRYSAGSLELSAVSLVLVFYGTSLLLIPTTIRILFPYAGLCAAGVAAPAVTQYYIGEPLAGLAAYLSAGLVSLRGVPVTWQGAQFELVSRSGGP